MDTIEANSRAEENKKIKQEMEKEMLASNCSILLI
jgi:hypothetical protein